MKKFLKVEVLIGENRESAYYIAQLIQNKKMNGFTPVGAREEYGSLMLHGYVYDVQEVESKGSLTLSSLLKAFGRQIKLGAKEMAKMTDATLKLTYFEGGAKMVQLYSKDCVNSYVEKL